MFLTTTKRIIKYGFINFWRNNVVSFASVLVVTITLLVLGSLIFLNAILDSSLAHIKDRVDINIYFNLDTEEEDILSLKTSLESLPEVSYITYVSREEALTNFRERHADDYLTIQALDELSDNPLPAAFNIKAKEPSQYASIAKYLERQNALVEGDNKIIDKINYYQNKVVIDKLSSIVKGIEKVGFVTTLALILLSIVITFNTIRLAIYISREEISIMKLVGADNKYVRGPFVFEGILYGLVSAILAMILFYPITLWMGDTITNFFGGINIFDYYLDNFFQIFIILIFSGVVVGGISSFLAVKRYLNK